MFGEKKYNSFVCDNFYMFMKTFSTFAFWIWCLASVWAQEITQKQASSSETSKDFQPYYRVGLKTGGNIAFANYSPSVFVGPVFGVHGGGIVQFVSQPYLGIQAELNFTQMGWTENPPGLPPYQKLLGFVELPLLTHLVFGKKNWNYIVNIGFWSGYLILEDEQNNLPFFQDVLEYRYPNDHHGKFVDNPVQVGACGGLALKYKTTIGEFQLEARYVSVLTRNFDNSIEFVQITPQTEYERRISFRNAENQAIKFSIAYLVDLKKILKKPKN